MRVEQLTFTRFLAAIAVVIYHFGGDAYPFNIGAINFYVSRANFGVSYFFLLSGFVMILAYGRDNWISFGTYIRKRFARIYPVYLLAIMLFLAYEVTYGQEIDPKGLWLNLLLLQSWVPGWVLSINSPGWSLSVEFFFYLLFPLLFNHFYKGKPFNILLVFILILFAISQAAFHLFLHSSYFFSHLPLSHEFAFYFPAMHLNEFLVGNLAGIFFLRYGKSNNFGWDLLLLLFCLGVVLKINTGVNYHNGMLAVFFIPMIILLACDNGRISRAFRWKPFVFLGEISYGVYILQFPVIHWSEKALISLGLENKTILFFIEMTLLIVAAALSYLFIETPLRKTLANKKVLF